MKTVTQTTTLVTGAALLVLWGVSWAASGLELGRWALVVAVGIAAIKAVLVVLFFMEISTERTSVRVAVAAGAVLVALMIALMVLDVRTRVA
jgi:cytochrome c oxidase subunit 4